jgi:MFS transporter, DHA1 family, inner membrane transport protein
MTSALVPGRVLPRLVLAQFAGTSPWFAVNAVMPDLQQAYGWPDSALGTLTSAVQFGFILGTLVFALGGVADRYNPRRVFLLCALAAAGCTLAALAVVLMAADLAALHALRAATGFFLAGIYPVGMKIAAQWYPSRPGAPGGGGLGQALGWLVGALVLGSASPHALRGLLATLPVGSLPWGGVMVGVALLAAAAGLLVALGLPDAPGTSLARPATGGPPSAPRPGWRLHLQALATLWTEPRVRASAFGYFGHMVELYTLWVLMPLILATRLQGPGLSWAAFVVLGAGMLGCVLGGIVAQRRGSAHVAAAQLATSGVCCAIAPWALAAPDMLFALWLLVWGITVAGDSPQLSTLTARNAPAQAMGSVLTFTNCIGFAISILSIEFFVRWTAHAPLATVLPWLGLGPLLGVLALRPLWRSERQG